MRPQPQDDKKQLPHYQRGIQKHFFFNHFRVLISSTELSVALFKASHTLAYVRSYEHIHCLDPEEERRHLVAADSSISYLIA